MLNTKHQDHQSITVAVLAWGTVALFFFYQYILRVSPGVMINEIRHDFGLTADQFGTLGSFYLYAYALLQIPLGIIVDRIGVRRTIVGSIILCLGGSTLMALSHIFAFAQLSRIMIGAGSASAFMCSLKIIADRLPPGSRGFLMGLTLTLGTVGALVAGKPLVYLLDTFGWRSAMFYTTIVGAFILIFAFIFLPKRQKGRPSLEQETIESIGKNVLSIIKNRRVMLYAFLAIGVYTPLSALADLWGTAFLMQKFALPRAEAAQTTMMLYIGLAIGSLFMPWLCEKYNILNLTIQICGVGILGLFAFLLYGPVISGSQLMFVLIPLGFFCGAEMMCFTGALLFSNPNNSGVTIGVVNTLNMLGGAVLQQFIGYNLDFQWSGLLDDQGIRLYTSHQFVIALSILSIVVLICCVASLKLRKQKSESDIVV